MVSMDMTTLNVSNCGQVKEGDIVQFWGAGLAVEKVAEWSDTISYELLCRVSPRVPRVILN
jgi:alanine racemase